MFFSLILENSSSDRIDMTTTANQYMTSKISGLYPPAGTVSTSTYAGMDGSYLNNAFIEKRNIVISFQMRGVDIEKRRHALYRVVKPSRYIKVYYKTAGIDVYAEGYVETCPVDNLAVRSAVRYLSSAPTRISTVPPRFTPIIVKLQERLCFPFRRVMSHFRWACTA